VTKFGGQIDFKSIPRPEAHHGTTFTFTFELEKEEDYLAQKRKDEL